MSQSLQTILNDFIKEKDKSVVKKKRTFESYITDLLKDYPAERTISVYLSQIGALYKIASPTTKNLGEGEIARYADELVQRFAVDKTKAKEMVRMWAIALGVQVPNQNSQPKSKDKEAQKDDTEEDNFFENVKRKNTIENYSEYIDKYPNGRYANEAKSKIDEFIQHKKEENIAWYKANREKIQKAYEKYLTKIDEFIKQEKADNFAWDKAKKENTKEAYENYLSKFSDGKHKKEASDKIDEFIKQERQERGTWGYANRINTLNFRTYIPINPQT